MSDDRLLYRITDVARLTSTSVSTVNRALARGHLVGKKLGNATVITAGDLERYIDDLPVLKSRALTKIGAK
jgi:hypothetical protein